jgi:hypothetical protein
VWKIVDWTHLAQDMDQWWAFVNTIRLWVSQKTENLLIIWVTISFLGWNLLYGVDDDNFQRITLITFQLTPSFTVHNKTDICEGR